MKVLNYILLLLLISKLSVACQCPVTSLTEAELAKYDIIFKGKIKSVKLNKGNSEAIFTVSELYKGLVSVEFTLLFDDADACKLELRPGDEWVIYANYHQIDNAKLDFCSRSRKFFKNVGEDFFEETTGVSFGEEVQFLQTKLGLHKPLKENPNKVENRNILPNTNQMILGFVCSLLGLLLFYWLFNRFFK
ncbi:MAG: hypothetical protein V4506_18230 [Bacteroidota bacterium]